MTVDLAILVVFLGFNIIGGLSYGRGVKNIKDYALGRRNFSTGTLVATIVATWTSGSMMFVDLASTYSDGLAYIIPALGFAFSFFIPAFILIPRMGNFIGKVSIAEAMGDLYGKNVRMIIAVAGTIGSAGAVAVQFKVFGNLFAHFFDLPTHVSIIIVSLVVTAYSAFGGVRAITFTDVIQFAAFGCVLPMLGIILWYDANNMNVDFSLNNALQNPRFNLKSLFDFGNPDFWDMLILFMYFTIPSLKPAWFQRVSMGNSVDQVKRAFCISGIVMIFIILAVSWIPFLLFNINPNLAPDNLLGHIIDNYTYTGLKGILIVSVIAMAMSTADSYINASAVLFAHDLCKPLNIAKNQELLLSKLFTIVASTIAIWMALTNNNLLSIMIFADGFYFPIVTPILFVTILGFRTSTNIILISMAAGFLTVILFHIIDTEAVDGIMIAVGVNIVVLLLFHYLLKVEGGWVGNKENKYLQQQKMIWTLRLKKILLVKNVNLLKIFTTHSPQNSLTYMGFGIYCIIYTITTMYSVETKFLGDNKILIIYQIMIITGTLMTSYPVWPTSVTVKKKEIFIKIWWYLATFYMLSFFSTLFVIVSKFNGLQFATFTINTIILVILLGWKLGICMLLSGYVLAVQCYKYYTGIDSFNIIIGSPAFIFMYLLILLGTVLVIFLKPKEEEQELALQRVDYHKNKLAYQTKELFDALSLKHEFLRNLQHETNNPLTGIKSMVEVCYAGYDNLSDRQKKECLENICVSSTRLASYIANITDLSKLVSMKYEFHMEPVDLTMLLHDRVKICKKLYKQYISQEHKEKYEFIFETPNTIKVTCDKYYITQVIDNIIINAIQYSNGGKITISVKINDKKSTIAISIKDEGIGLSNNDVYKIFEVFTVGDNTKTPAGGRGVGLALCNKIIDLHKGKIWVESDGQSGSKFTFTLPL